MIQPGSSDGNGINFCFRTPRMTLAPARNAKAGVHQDRSECPGGSLLSVLGFFPSDFVDRMNPRARALSLFQMPCKLLVDKS